MSLLTGKISGFLKIGVAAAGRGDLETVLAVLAERPDWLLRVGSHGRTMLWEAAYRGRLAMVEWLLDQGANIHAWGCHFTPLLVDISPYCVARFKNHDAVAECLCRDPGLATAERVQYDTNVRATVLHYAVGAGYLDIVCLLLEWGADPRLCGDWLVRFCIWRDRADILKVLLNAGLDPATAEVPRSGLTLQPVKPTSFRRGSHGEGLPFLALVYMSVAISLDKNDT